MESWKRKGMGEERKIYLVFRSIEWDKAAAIYELRLTRYQKENKTRREEEEIVAENTRLKLISTFYDQNRNKPIGYVACAPLAGAGAGAGLLLIMPNEFDEANRLTLSKEMDFTRESPCLFNPITNTTTNIPFPLARKVSPFAATVGDKVYVLSCRNIIQPVLPEPSFESFNVNGRVWEALEPPPSNVNIGLDSPMECTFGWRTSGYAVFGGYLVVCFRNYRTSPHPNHSVFSFDTTEKNNSREWRRVDYPTPQVSYDGNVIRNYDGHDYEDDDDDDDSEFRIWSGEAVIINGYLYAYLSDFGGFVSYSCTENNKKKKKKNGFDLSLGKRIVLESDESRDWQYMKNGCFIETGAVGRIGSDLVCMVKTISCWSKFGTPRQPVLVCVFRVLDDGRCVKLNSLDLYIKGTSQFDCALISSVLNPEVVSSLEHGERSAKKPAVSDKDDVEMMDASMA